MSDDAWSPGRDSAGGPRANFALFFAALLGAAASCPGQNAAPTAASPLPEVVVQAERQAADEEVTRQVTKALTDDPWIFGDHITVTTHNGVVRVEGIVGDTGEMFRIMRLARKIPGARRVVNALEMMHNDPDGG
jgi:BON domain